jgi:hypothetical protein
MWCDLKQKQIKTYALERLPIKYTDLVKTIQILQIMSKPSHQQFISKQKIVIVKPWTKWAMESKHSSIKMDSISTVLEFYVCGSGHRFRNAGDFLTYLATKDINYHGRPMPFP